MFSDHFITNLPQNAQVKNGESISTWQRYGQKFVAYFFGPPCILFTRAQATSVI